MKYEFYKTAKCYKNRNNKKINFILQMCLERGENSKQKVQPMMAMRRMPATSEAS